MTSVPPSKPDLIIPVGIPGCGKSTYGDRIYRQPKSALIISTDLIRENLAGDASDQSRNDEVFDLYHLTIERLLTGGVSIYADATNVQAFARKRLKDIADKAGAETHVVLFRNPLQAIRRNAARERVVPNNAMQRMIRRYERSLLEIPQEGYASVTEIRSMS